MVLLVETDLSLRYLIDVDQLATTKNVVISVDIKSEDGLKPFTRY